MKMSLGKRFVLLLHWVFALIGCLLALGYCAKPEWIQQFITWLEGLLGHGGTKILGIAALGVYLLLAAVTVVLLVRTDKKRGERGFIVVDSSDAGRTRIAVGAVEQMIRQAVRGVEGISEMKASINNCEDAIGICVNASIQSGAHVPTITMNIQRAIRSYIELNCGVAVREVSVSIHSIEAEGESGRLGKKKSFKLGSEAEQTPYRPPVVDLHEAAEPVVEAPKLAQAEYVMPEYAAPEVEAPMDSAPEAAAAVENDAVPEQTSEAESEAFIKQPEDTEAPITDAQEQ